jgi:hypothetical protein
MKMSYHVSSITGVVLEALAADVAGEELDVRVRGDVVLQVVAGEEALAAKLANVNPTLLTRIVLKREAKKCYRWGTIVLIRFLVFL